MKLKNVGLVALMSLLGEGSVHAAQAQDLFLYKMITPEKGEYRECGEALKHSYDQFKNAYSSQFDTLQAHQQAALVLAEELIRASDLSFNENEKKSLLSAFKGMTAIASLRPQANSPAVDLYEAFFGINTEGDKIDKKIREVAFASLSFGPLNSFLTKKRILSPLINRRDSKLKIKFDPKEVIQLIQNPSDLTSASSFFGAKSRKEIEGLARISEHSKRKPLDVAYWLRGAKGKRGVDFDNFLVEEIDSSNFIISNGTVTQTISGSVGNIWFEAKSNEFWSNDFGFLGFSRFQSDTEEQIALSKENGKEFELISVTAIPREAKEWLDGKGVHYIELNY